MKMTTVVCEQCGIKIKRPQKEVTRSLLVGRRFFCNNSCGAKYNNAPRKAAEITKICPTCNLAFISSTKKKSSRFCSTSCANKVPRERRLTPEGKEAQRQAGIANKANLMSAADVLKSREAWKYTELERALIGVPHEFEFALGDYVFDLALPGLSILVEFDGKYHTGKQLSVDSAKDALAVSQGLSVVRIKTDDTKVIPSVVLNELLGNARRRLVTN